VRYATFGLRKTIDISVQIADGLAARICIRGLD